MMKYTKNIFLLIFLFHSFFVSAQEYVYDFGNNIPRIDEIINDEIAKKNRADIVHIGDSHVQSGFFSEVIRNSFQKKYGDAGKGIVCLHHLYGSNDTNDIYVKNLKGRFSGFTVSRHNLKNPISLSAVEINSGSNTNISIILKSKNKPFKNIIIFRSKNSSSLICDNYENIKISHDLRYWVSDTILLRNKTNDIKLNSDNILKDRVYSAIYLYNDNKGVVFNSIGVNGATLEHFDNIDYFKEVSRLSPKFIIISLGTNDGYTSKFDVVKFRNTMDSFSQHLKQVFPDIPLLFTTPPPSCLRQVYRHKRKKRIRYMTNPNIKVISSEIINCAKKYNFAVVDLYSALGGDDAVSKLLNKKELGHDRVHYTVEGYRSHGRIVAKSLNL